MASRKRKILNMEQRKCKVLIVSKIANYELNNLMLEFFFQAT